MLAIGLMSGTSRDGVDAALVTTDGRAAFAAGAALTLPYEADFRARLASVMGGRGDVAGVERELTLRHAEAVQALLRSASLLAGEIGVVGFHGQTILHDPEHGRTWQIGDGALLAECVGIDVVNDFRGADVAAGGHGAPLVPLFHGLLTGAMQRPVAVLNIGGVANVTWVGAGKTEESLLAFDTGPGNALLDDWALHHTGEPVDHGGALARRGRVDEAVLARLLQHRYFRAAPPKSLDRDAFAALSLGGLSAEDGAATLVAFTAASVARAREHFPAPVRGWIVTGGGRRNPVLMAALAERLAQPVMAAEELGWDGDALEAQAFAYLAVRSLQGLALSLPSTTGVPRPLTGGRLYRAKRSAG